ncbi:MAG: AtpZ/AtpI family protein [Rhizobiaceae bacterium]
MAKPDDAGDAGDSRPGHAAGKAIRDDELQRRSRELEAVLATKRTTRPEQSGGSKSGSMAGYGKALKLSSEFIAGIAVGAGIGWLIDSWAGTSPWGLIVFLMLGFGAGVLNVARSAGVVAEFGQADRTDREK